MHEIHPVFLGTSGSDRHTGKKHYPGTSYEAGKNSTCFVTTGTWSPYWSGSQRLGMQPRGSGSCVSSWCSQQLQGWGTDLASPPLVQTKWSPFGSYWVRAALRSVKTGRRYFSVLAARSQGFTLHSLLTTVCEVLLMADCIWAPACSAAPVRALLSPGPASLGRPARNQAEE